MVAFIEEFDYLLKHLDAATINQVDRGWHGEVRDETLYCAYIHPLHVVINVIYITIFSLLQVILCCAAPHVSPGQAPRRDDRGRSILRHSL